MPPDHDFCIIGIISFLQQSLLHSLLPRRPPEVDVLILQHFVLVLSMKPQFPCNEEISTLMTPSEIGHDLAEAYPPYYT
jgi:hypothetical protein